MNAQQLQFLVIILSAILGLALVAAYAIAKVASNTCTKLEGLVEEGQNRIASARQELETQKANYSEYLHLSQEQARTLQQKIHDQGADLANLQTNQELHIKLLDEANTEMVRLRNHNELLMGRAEDYNEAKAHAIELTEELSQVRQEMVRLRGELLNSQSAGRIAENMLNEMERELNDLKTKLWDMEQEVRTFIVDVFACEYIEDLIEVKTKLDGTRYFGVEVSREPLKNKDDDIPTEQIIKDINEADKPSPKKFQLFGLFKKTGN